MGPKRYSGGRLFQSYWYPIFLCWLLYVFVGAYQIAPSSVIPVIMTELSLGPTAASWVMSVLFLSMAVGAIPIGMALDGVDNRNALLLSSAWLCAASLWSWYAGTTGGYLSLLGSRLFGGLGVVAIWTASVNAVGNIAPHRTQATAITIYATSVPLGFAVGQFATPQIAERFGWAFSFPLYGSMTLVVTIAFWLVGRNYDVNAASETSPSRSDFLAVFRQPSVWAIATLGCIGISLTFIVNNWMPTYFRDQYQLSLAQSGLFAAVFPAIGLLSRGSSGVLSDRVFGRRRKPIITVAFLVTAPAVIGIVLVGSVGLTLGLLVIAGFFSQIGLVLLYVYVRELVAPNVVGTALAVVNALGFLGAFAAPILTGLLIEWSGGYLLAFAASGAIALFAAVLTQMLPESDPTRE